MEARRRDKNKPWEQGVLPSSVTGEGALWWGWASELLDLVGGLFPFFYLMRPIGA